MEKTQTNTTQTDNNWGTSYGQMVSREFFKSILNKLSLGFIILLFTIAVLAPFIANDKPYCIKIDGSWKFPLLTTLTANDITVLLFAIAAIILLVFARRNSRKIDPSMRSAVFGRQLSITLAATIILSITSQWLVPHKNITTDYKELAVSGKAEGAVFAPVPYSYARTSLKDRYLPPSKEHLFGTDDVGSDLLARVIHGSRISLSVGFVAVGISLVIGIFVGAILGYFGGKIDFIGMRIIEIVMAVPTFFLIITIVAFYERSLFNIMVIIGVTSWTGHARFVRAEFLKLRQQDFVQAAKALGLPLRSILFRHMLPNGVAPVLVSATFGIAAAIFTEAALSFLGFGVVPPTPSWGQMLSRGVSVTGEFLWWLSLFPGMAIFLTAIAYNMLGEGLRDAIDPKLRK
ncbi:MAG: ABC transporter permease [Sedimentisphaeraceae bacterium JB056]